ncbi:hypothetical protein [Paenibacillus xylanexedens]|uniref:hypothetical protein n=1 Tax=Paenibacillus xylanexedens TaxID=528191 RepID=UPI0011A9C15C|nr:hypothetical protein [Paenibacillus xylanexedens]
MEGRLTTSIVLYGKIETDDMSQWQAFYHLSKQIITNLNLEPNYIGISGDFFSSKKIKTLARMEMKLLKSFGDGRDIESLEIYALPENFTVAAFDYDMYISRSKHVAFDYIIATLTSEAYQNVDQEKLVRLLKRCINFDSGEIFELSYLESPVIYATKANAPSSFKTLRILENLANLDKVRLSSMFPEYSDHLKELIN